jgi:hypothetical protein
VIVDGQPIYGNNWQPAPVDNQGYRANSPAYIDNGYKVDNDGARIIQEDPLPPGANPIQ